MKKIFPIVVFFCLLSAGFVFSEEIEINSEVVHSVPGSEFFIIGAGEDMGVEIGDGLIVHRDGEKIAEAYIIEVRQNVSAAEILNIEHGEGVEEGDNILIVKVIEEVSVSEGMARIPEKRPPTPKSKWATILGGRSDAPVITETKIAPDIEPAYTARASVAEIGDIISIMIDRDSKSVFTYAATVLRENGYSITSSSRTTGTLLATRHIALSLMKELWADAVAAIDHKLVVSFDIKSEGDSSRLMVAAFKEHSQKGKQIKRAVSKNSKYYNEIVSIISKIKERSEH